MKYAHLYLLLIACSLFSCSPKTTSVNNGPLVITHQEADAAAGKVIRFTIKNNTKEGLTIIDPNTVSIQLKDGTDWKNVRILSCPCGAPCARPPSEMTLQPDKSNELTWNKKEEWCEGLSARGIPNSFSENAVKGTYRIKIRYRQADSMVESGFHQFQID